MSGMKNQIVMVLGNDQYNKKNVIKLWKIYIL